MPSKAYINPEAPTVWADSGGDKLIELQNLGGIVGTTNPVACGAALDLGAGSRADEYEIEILIDGWNDKVNGTVPAGASVLVYMASSNDGTNWNGLPITAPTASTVGEYTVAQLANLQSVRDLTIYGTVADQIRARAVVRLPSRYVAPVVWNPTYQRIGFNGNHAITLRPIPMEAQ